MLNEYLGQFNKNRNVYTNQNTMIFKFHHEDIGTDKRAEENKFSTVEFNTFLGMNEGMNDTTFSEKNIFVNDLSIAVREAYEMMKSNNNRMIDTNAPRSNSTNEMVNNTDYEGVPYSYLADDNGFINYNGVVFQCDNEMNAICLGDMSEKDNILTIPLTDGGTLRVNRNSINGLAKAIGMFSPEDMKRILDAIATDAKVKNKEGEIKEQVSKTLQNLSNSNEE